MSKPRAPRGTVALAAALALAAAWAAAGCGAGGGDGDATDLDWPRWGNTAANTRHSPLDQIDRGNVDRLRLAWTRTAGGSQRAWETFPIVVGRTMYFDTGTERVIAVDAASGRERWSHQPPVDVLAGPVGAYGGEPISRGVTYGAGRIYATTADGQLLALDAGSGRPRWRVRVIDPAVGPMNSPGTFWAGRIVVGGPAGAAGRRGFVAAYDAADGELLWRTHMVPPRGRGWRRGPDVGGGNVWMPPTIDPATGTVYVATGNPTPGFSAAERPGCNPLANAVVALDGRSGRIEWARTLVCRDSWDYDTVQAPLLLGGGAGGGEGDGGGEGGSVDGAGKGGGGEGDDDGGGSEGGEGDDHDGGGEGDAGERGASEGARIVGAGSKAGFYAFLDAGDGAVAARSPYLTRYSRPHLVPTRAGVVVCPGIYGGLQYGPPAYSPRERLLFVAGNQMCMRYRLAAPGRAAAAEAALGGTATQVGRASGVVAALDPASGAVRWRTPLPAPANGGLLATAGGLVFLGEDDGWLRALDAASGEPLWRHRLGLRVGSAPLTYRVDGVQYLAIAAGGSLVRARGTAPDGPAELFVFRLPS